MPAAEKRHDTDETLTVVLVATGETVTMRRRPALGLLSLQRATLPKAKAKKSNVSTAAPDGGQDGALAGNKPLSGDTNGARA